MFLIREPVSCLLIALYEDNDTMAAFNAAGLGRSRLEKAIKTVRGNRKVSSSNAENTYQALDKYSIDLVKAAANGKLDPVIGRDEIIRRVVQVLQRKTKNNPLLVGPPGKYFSPLSIHGYHIIL